MPHGLRLLKYYFSYRADFAEVSIGYCGEKGPRCSPRSAYPEQENSPRQSASNLPRIALAEAARLERTTWPGRGFSESRYSRSRAARMSRSTSRLLVTNPVNFLQAGFWTASEAEARLEMIHLPASWVRDYLPTHRPEPVRSSTATCPPDGTPPHMAGAQPCFTQE